MLVLFDVVALYDVVAFYGVMMAFFLFYDAVVVFFFAVGVAATDLADLPSIFSHTRVFLADEQMWQMPHAHPLSALSLKERNRQDCITCVPGPCKFCNP